MTTFCNRLCDAISPWWSCTSVMCDLCSHHDAIHTADNTQQIDAMSHQQCTVPGCLHCINLSASTCCCLVSYAVCWTQACCTMDDRVHYKCMWCIILLKFVVKHVIPCHGCAPCSTLQRWGSCFTQLQCTWGSSKYLLFLLSPQRLLLQPSHSIPMGLYVLQQMTHSQPCRQYCQQA